MQGLTQLLHSISVLFTQLVLCNVYTRNKKTFRGASGQNLSSDSFFRVYEALRNLGPLTATPHTTAPIVGPRASHLLRASLQNSIERDIV